MSSSDQTGKSVAELLAEHGWEPRTRGGFEIDEFHEFSTGSFSGRCLKAHFIWNALGEVYEGLMGFDLVPKRLTSK